MIDQAKISLFIDEKFNILKERAAAAIAESPVNRFYERMNGGTAPEELLAQVREAQKEMKVELQAFRDEISQALASGHIQNWPKICGVLRHADGEASLLIDAINRQGRELALMAGEKIEPMTHFAEVVIVGTGNT